MANDSESYIHPIIQAMIASADSKDRALALAQKDKTDSEEAKFRRDQLAEVVKRAEQEHQINLGHLDLARQQFDLAHNEFKTRAMHGILEDIASGVRPVASLPSAPTIPTALNSQPGDPSQTATPSPQSVAPTPNFSQMPAAGPSDSQDGNIDIAGTSMPRAAVAQIPQNVADQKGRVAEAVAAPQIARDKQREDAQAAREMANEVQRHKDAQDQLAMQQRFLEHQKDLDRQNHLDVMAVRSAALQHGVDPEDIHSLMEDATTGNADLSGTTKPVLAARTAVQEAGRKPFGPKDAAALKASVTLQDWIDKLRNFANTQLSTSKTGAFISGAIANNPLVKTDARTQYDEIQTGLINAGKALEGVSGGRITIPQMRKLEEGATSLYTTRDNALKLANNLQNLLHTNVDTKILGGIPETQRQLIFHAQGVTPERLGLNGSPTTTTQLPDFLKVAPPKNKRGTALNINESIKANKPVYGEQ
jgi:hypothetical protein